MLQNWNLFTGTCPDAPIWINSRPSHSSNACNLLLTIFPAHSLSASLPRSSVICMRISCIVERYQNPYTMTGRQRSGGLSGASSFIIMKMFQINSTFLLPSILIFIHWFLLFTGSHLILMFSYYHIVGTIAPAPQVGWIGEHYNIVIGCGLATVNSFNINNLVRGCLCEKHWNVGICLASLFFNLNFSILKHTSVGSSLCHLDNTSYAQQLESARQI